MMAMKFVFMSIGGNSVGIFGDLYIESAYQFVHEVPLEEYHICEVYFKVIKLKSQWFGAFRIRYSPLCIFGRW
jgi:hypothetical protein